MIAVDGVIGDDSVNGSKMSSENICTTEPPANIFLVRTAFRSSAIFVSLTEVV